MPNSIFIDTSNLNVMFKVNGRFALGVNYASCPDKLAIDMQALGTSYDVYLSMWPRQVGEGDDVVNALSVGGVPFVVLRDEVEAVFKLVEKVPGVGNVYLCNALANFVIQARVANFQSVINYGSRVALVEVKNKLLEKLVIYNNPEELYEVQGESLSCYGDLDLIDVDAVKAQYEELTPFAKGILVPLAHLVTSYRSSYNADMDTVKQELGLGEYASQRREEAPPPEPPKPKRAPKEFVKSAPVEDDEEEQVQFKKPGISILNVLLVLVILAGCALTGLGYAFSQAQPQISQLQTDIAPFTAEAKKYSDTANIYVRCGGIAGEAADLLNYVQTNTDGFTISGLEVRLDSIVIRCNTSNPDAIESFRTYLEGSYVVGEVNNLDTTAGASGVTLYNYSVTIVRQ